MVLGMLLLPAAACFAQSIDSGVLRLPSGRSVQMRANAVNAASYQWLRDGRPIEGGNQQSFVVQQSGSYTVITYNALGCESEISDPVVVIIEPGVRPVTDLMVKKSSELKSIRVNDPFMYTIRVGNNGPITATGVRVTDVLPDGLNFEQLQTPLLGQASFNNGSKTVLWQIDSLANGSSAELKIKVKAVNPGVIKNTATVTGDQDDSNLANNVSEDSKSILGIVIPTVFTPNDDGKNDTFVIPGIEDYENEVTILNRWGGTIYTAKGYKNDWKGEGLNEGTYYYVIKIKPNAGRWEALTGYITLLRVRK